MLRRASCDTAAPASSAKDNTAFRRSRSEPLHTTKPRDESTAPTRVSSTAVGGARRDPSALRSLAARARTTRPDSAEAPLTPSAFVAQLRQRCEKLLPAPERKPHRIVLGVPRAVKRSGVPSAPKTN